MRLAGFILPSLTRQGFDGPNPRNAPLSGERFRQALAQEPAPDQLEYSGKESSYRSYPSHLSYPTPPNSFTCNDTIFARPFSGS